MSVTGHKETIDHVEPLEELLEGLAVEAFKELLCRLLVGFSGVDAAARQRCVPATVVSFHARSLNEHHAEVAWRLRRGPGCYRHCQRDRAVDALFGC